MKNVVVVILIVTALAGIYFGAYLPWEKAQLYIATNKASASFRTVNDIVQAYEKALTFYSPIGNRELIKFSINNMTLYTFCILV